MNNKCNNCAKFLTCNKKQCKRISFVEAEILDKPKIKVEYDKKLDEFYYTTQEAAKQLQQLQRAIQKLGQYRK